MKEEIKEIREYISCPQLGDDYYGEWGALRLDQRLKIKSLLDNLINLQEKVNKLTAESTEWESKCYDLQEENERLKNGYCELKVKCNNGECDCTNEEYDGMIESNIKLSLEVERLNNIINELDKLIEQYSKNEYYYKYNGKYLKSEIINDLKELKGE